MYFGMQQNEEEETLEHKIKAQIRNNKQHGEVRKE
jgi:hypothetical protein